MICYSYKKSYFEIVNIVIVNKNIWTYHVVGHGILENNEMEKKSDCWFSLKNRYFSSWRCSPAHDSQFQLVRKPQICFAPGAPWTPDEALPLYPAGDLGSPQTPCLVPATFSYSPAPWHLFDNPVLVLYHNMISPYWVVYFLSRYKLLSESIDLRMFIG